MTPGRACAEAHDRSLFGDETPVPWGEPDSPAVTAWEAAAEAVAAPLRDQLAAVRRQLEYLADGLEKSAAATAPSKKSQVEAGCAVSIRDIIANQLPEETP